jgi:ATP-dependent DNA ligase
LRCRPGIGAEIAYRDPTREGIPRHARFKGIVQPDA